MRPAPENEMESTVAVRIAGEDIARGDFVALFSQVFEFPSFYWNCSPVVLPHDEAVKIRFMTAEAGIPHKVIGVCLPFVYAKANNGEVVVFDLRLRQLVKLNRECARSIWKEMKTNSNVPANAHALRREKN